MTAPATTPAPDPGIRFPPPLMFALGLAAGIALDRYVLAWPLVGASHAHWLYAPAAGFGLVAIWLVGSALGIFHRAGTDPRPWREDSALVVDGIYRQTRNPMYVGMAAAYVAITLALDAAWPLLTLVPVLLVIRNHVVLREEAYLRKRFGPAYFDYCLRVRRWF
jgi:protein-S-isoprenylcysteine O-methyltransferase Ste14